MNEDTPSTVLRAQERVREVIKALQEGLDDPSLFVLSVQVGRRALETQEQLLAGVE